MNIIKNCFKPNKNESSFFIVHFDGEGVGWLKGINGWSGPGFWPGNGLVTMTCGGVSCPHKSSEST